MQRFVAKFIYHNPLHAGEYPAAR
jgi:sphinganine-1-phosphate aldolase